MKKGTILLHEKPSFNIIGFNLLFIAEEKKLMVHTVHFSSRSNYNRHILIFRKVEKYHFTYYESDYPLNEFDRKTYFPFVTCDDEQVKFSHLSVYRINYPNKLFCIEISAESFESRANHYR